MSDPDLLSCGRAFLALVLLCLAVIAVSATVLAVVAIGRVLVLQVL